MESYAGREQTFSRAKPRWPHPPSYIATPASLAAAGFYFSPASAAPDAVACFLCDKGLADWEAHDDPAQIHLQKSPKCPWALLHSTPNHAPASRTLHKARLATFGSWWPHQSRPKGPHANMMANAGFIYTPAHQGDDTCTCIYCHIQLGGWLPDDDPMEEHHKRQSKRGPCSFFATRSRSKSRQPPPTDDSEYHQHSHTPPPAPSSKSKSKSSRKKHRSIEDEVVEEYHITLDNNEDKPRPRPRRGSSRSRSSRSATSSGSRPRTPASESSTKRNLKSSTSRPSSRSSRASSKRTFKESDSDDVDERDVARELALPELPPAPAPTPSRKGKGKAKPKAVGDLRQNPPTRGKAKAAIDATSNGDVPPTRGRNKAKDEPRTTRRSSKAEDRPQLTRERRNGISAEQLQDNSAEEYVNSPQPQPNGTHDHTPLRVSEDDELAREEAVLDAQARALESLYLATTPAPALAKTPRSGDARMGESTRMDDLGKAIEESPLGYSTPPPAPPPITPPAAPVTPLPPLAALDTRPLPQPLPQLPAPAAIPPLTEAERAMTVEQWVRQEMATQHARLAQDGRERIDAFKAHAAEVARRIEGM